MSSCGDTRRARDRVDASALRASRGLLPSEIMGKWTFRALRSMVFSCVFVIGGCGDESGHDGDEGSTGDDAAYDHAVLRVHAPEAGSIHPVGEPIAVVAEVLDLDGFPLAVKDVVWRSDLVEHVLHASMHGDVTVPVGVHEIGTTVRLPNGNRLAAAVGGVRVQSPATGVYVGETVLRMEMEFEGQTVRPACVAGLAFTVDMAGERIRPQTGSCTLELLLTSFEAEYLLDAKLDGEIVRGTIHYDIGGIFKLPFDFEGSLRDGVFIADFDGDLTLPLLGTGSVEGRLNATRVTQLVE